jgi:hypothetical protein
MKIRRRDENDAQVPVRDRQGDRRRGSGKENMRWT